jgi:hypothetical protein
VSDLGHILNYMHTHSAAFSGVQLVNGTQPWTPSLIGLVPIAL